MIPLIIISSIMGYSSFFNMIAYGLLIKVSLRVDMMMKKALVFIIQVIDSKIVNVPDDWQKIYSELKGYMQVQHVGTEKK